MHDVPDFVDAFGDVFPRELCDGGGAGAKEQVGDVVGGDAVDFLEHGAVVAAQAGLDGGDGYVEFCGGESAG